MADKFLNQTGLSHLVTKLKTMISGKVDKEVGKGLSSNDFTDSYIDTIDGLAPSVSFNKTLYVDASTGDDTNTGDSSAKFKTIEKAVREAVKYRHCIIMLSPGTYDTSAAIDIRGAVALSIRGNNLSDTIINGRFSVGRDAYVSIQNVTVQGTTSTSDGSFFVWENGQVYCLTCNLKPSGGICLQVASGGVCTIITSTLDGTPTYPMRVQSGGLIKAYNVTDNTGKKSNVMNTGVLNLNGCTGATYSTSTNGVVIVDGIQVAPKLVNVDSALSPTSENPVQNRVVASRLAELGAYYKSVYISATNGNDENDGSLSSPIATISRALELTNLYQNALVSFVFQDSSTYNHEDGLHVFNRRLRIDCTSSTPATLEFPITLEESIATISNVKITNTTSSAAIHLNRGSYVFINNATITTDGSTYCVYCTNGSKCELYECTVNSGTCEYAIYMTDTSCADIYNCTDGGCICMLRCGNNEHSITTSGGTYPVTYLKSTGSVIFIDGVLVTSDCAGKKVEGKVFTVDDQEVTAAVGAEIFNDYSNNIATGEYAHAEGANNRAVGPGSHVEGGANLSSGVTAHCEGYINIASGDYSHAEGGGNEASGDFSHAEGKDNKAIGMFSHVEGSENTASGNFSHVGGYRSEGGDGSFVYGYNLVGLKSQFVFGEYNLVDENNDYIFILGNGESEDTRSNAVTIDHEGNITTKNQYTVLDSGNYSTYLNPVYKMSTSSKALYVDATNGNDNNTGTSTSKFKTIDKAISEGIKYGSCIINLADGTYDMSSGVIDIRGSMSLSIRGTTAGSTIINGRFSVDRGACITFEKLVINAAATTSNGGIFAYESASVYVNNCEINTTAGYCINSSSNSRVFLTSTKLSGTPTQCLRMNSGGSITANACTNTTGTYAMCSNSCSLYLNNCTDLTYAPTGYGAVCVDGVTYSRNHVSRTQTLIYESTFTNGLIEIDGLFTKYSSVFVTVTNFKVGDFIGSGSFVLPLQYIKSLGYYSDTNTMTTFNYGTFDGYSGTLGVNVACVSDNQMYVVHANTTGVDISNTGSAGTIRIFTI